MKIIQGNFQKIYEAVHNYYFNNDNYIPNPVIRHIGGGEYGGDWVFEDVSNEYDNDCEWEFQLNEFTQNFFHDHLIYHEIPSEREIDEFIRIMTEEREIK